MFGRLILWGTDHGFKVLRHPIFDLWATPFFRTRDFDWKLENLHYIQFVQMRCRFLCSLVPEIDCNYLFKEITKGNDILEEIILHYYKYYVLWRIFRSALAIPKNRDRCVSHIHLTSASENARVLYLLTYNYSTIYNTLFILSPESIFGTLETSSGSNDILFHKNTSDF